MTTSAIEVCTKFSRKRVKGKHSSASKNERDLHILTVTLYQDILSNKGIKLQDNVYDVIPLM